MTWDSGRHCRSAGIGKFFICELPSNQRSKDCFPSFPLKHSPLLQGSCCLPPVAEGIFIFSGPESFNSVRSLIIASVAPQVLSLICCSPARAPASTLVVCPLSVIPHWQEQLQRFAPALRVHVHHGPTAWLTRDPSHTETSHGRYIPPPICGQWAIVSVWFPSFFWGRGADCLFLPSYRPACVGK